MRYAWLLISLACLCLAACGGATPFPTSGSSSTSTSATSAAPNNRATVAPNGKATPTGSIVAAPTNSPLAGFKILSPRQDAVVTTPEVKVTGQAAPETTVTLNDEIVVVDQSGAFSVNVPLAEGPNAIEVIASDVKGNEVNLELDVTYDPGS